MFNKFLFWYEDNKSIIHVDILTTMIAFLRIICFTTLEISMPSDQLQYISEKMTQFENSIMKFYEKSVDLACNVGHFGMNKKYYNY